MHRLRPTLISHVWKFARRSNVSTDGLVCDGVSVEAIANSVGTPVYVYSADTIRARYRAIHEAFGTYPHALHYALKANSTFALVQLLHALGSAADANSIWEIDV